MSHEALSGEQFEDYRGRHQPDAGGPPLHNLTEPGNYMDGSDVYEHPRHYVGTEHPQESIRQMRRARGNPDHTATIYRAAPRGVEHINHGDWVTLSHRYAAEHAKHPTDPHEDMPTIKAQVPAHHVRFAGDDLNEWGYFGPSVKADVHRDPRNE
jgi:hypothetical protein